MTCNANSLKTVPRKGVSTKTASVLLAIALGSGVAFAQTAGHGSDQLKKSMESGMKSMQSMSMSGDTDKDFAMMMKMHH